MQDNPWVLWIRPVDQIYTIAAGASTRTAHQAIEGVLPARTRVDTDLLLERESGQIGTS